MANTLMNKLITKGIRVTTKLVVLPFSNKTKDNKIQGKGVEEIETSKVIGRIRIQGEIRTKGI